MVVVLLILYWYIPIATIINSDSKVISGERIFWGVFSTVIGICLMIGSDTQKFTQLKFKKGLIKDHFFALTRNPNYLGEILIYGGFGIVSADCTAWVILLSVWIGVFATRMLAKELSYMKKDGWAEYKEQSLILLPRLTADYWQNYAIYAGLFLLAWCFYSIGGLFRIFGLN